MSSGDDVKRLLDELETTISGSVSPAAVVNTKDPVRSAPPAPSQIETPSDSPAGDNKYLIISLSSFCVILIAAFAIYYFWPKKGPSSSSGEHEEELLEEENQDSAKQSPQKKTVRFKSGPAPATSAPRATAPPPQQQPQPQPSHVARPAPPATTNPNVQLPPPREGEANAPPPQQQPVNSSDQSIAGYDENGLPVDVRGQVLNGGKNDPNGTPIMI